MKITFTAGREPVAEKAVWDLLAFLHSFLKPVTVVILDGEPETHPAVGYAIAWCDSLKIRHVRRADSKGAPDAVIAVCPDLDSRTLVDKAKEAGIRVYEVNNV